MTRTVCRAETPVGVLTAVYENGELRRVLFPDEAYSAAGVAVDDTLPFARQIAEYFSGGRRAFDLPLALPGSGFARKVYDAVLRIPYGRTASYSEIALAAGHPGAARAVGNVMHDTPAPIVIPCHRVVHKSGTKAAYRGGTDAKAYLLDMEKRFISRGVRGEA